MNRYKIELFKVIFLLCVGASIASYVIFSVIFEVGFGAFEGSDLFTILFVILYPLGLFYNFGSMMGFTTTTEHHGPADRYYTVEERNVYHSMNFSAMAIRFALVMTLGWIPGVFKAFKKLRYLKSLEQNK